VESVLPKQDIYRHINGPTMERNHMNANNVESVLAKQEL